jgi:hypothetical protein
VVVEAQAEQLEALIAGTTVDRRTFLPHMRVAVTGEEHDADDLREGLASLREERLGTAVALEAKRIRLPAARTTLFQPWQVVETVSF